MKLSFAFLLVVIGVCIACASKSTSSQTPQSVLPQASPTPTQSTDAVVSDKVPCSLVNGQAPVINGLMLGMTAEQVLTLFPGSSEDSEVRGKLSRPLSPFGESGFSIKPEKYQAQEKFAGISQLNFTLLDSRLYVLRIGYNGPQWPHIDNFLEKFTEGTNLPAADAWQAYPGLDTQMKTLRCKDFEVQVFAGGQGGNLNYVLMTDLVAAKKLKEREDRSAARATP